MLTQVLNRIASTRFYEAPTGYSHNFLGKDLLLNWFQDIVRNNKKVFLYGDYDVDGVMGLNIWKLLCQDLNIAHTCYSYTKRTHNLDPLAVQECLKGHQDYAIITDTGSSEADLKEIQNLTRKGIRVVVVDHHNTTLSYEDFGPEVLLINNTLQDNEWLQTCGAGLAYLCCDFLYSSFEFKRNPKAEIYALIAAYADCEDMSNCMNRYLYYKCMELSKDSFPKTVSHFLGNYDTFNKRYITFQYAPRINALMRSERFDLLNPYLVNEDANIAISELVCQIDSVYAENRTLVGIMTDIIKYEVWDYFVVANLSSVKPYLKNIDNVQNYTGLVANKLASIHNKTSVVYCSDNNDIVKGSLRDSLGRNFLDVFKRFVNADGHDGAFGFYLDYKDFKDFFNQLELLDHVCHENRDSLVLNEREPILISMPQQEPDIEVLKFLADYNEFAGGKWPIALVNRIWMGGNKSTYRYTKYYHHYAWGKLWMKSNKRLISGSLITIMPVNRKNLELRILDSGISC